MNKTQLNAAQEAMVEWLADPHELGKRPNKIECAGEFEYSEMRYYIFKFKKEYLASGLLVYVVVSKMMIWNHVVIYLVICKSTMKLLQKVSVFL